MKQKKAKEGRIRGPKLEVFISDNPGAIMEEAIIRADSEKRVISSNKRLDQALFLNDEWKNIRFQITPWPNSSCWSGTMGAFVEPYGSFRESAQKISSLRNGYFIVDA